MKKCEIEIEGITLAVFNLEKMLTFYTNVFEIQFDAKDMFGTTLYSGDLGNLKLLFCPAEIARNKARQNRHQLDIIVSDLDQMLEKINNFGGEIMGQIIIEKTYKSLGFYDPDKNSIVLKQLNKETF